MDLGSVFRGYFVKGVTGQLSIKFTETAYLCKVYIEDGQAVYISFGRKSPEDALNFIVDKTVDWTNFLKNYLGRKKLDQPLNDRLLAITVPSEGAVAKGNRKAEPSRAGELLALSRKIDEIIVKKGMDKTTTRGKIGLKAGVLMSFDKTVPDDLDKMEKIKGAVKEILGEEI